jgi:hypothetical protein
MTPTQLRKLASCKVLSGKSTRGILPNAMLGNLLLVALGVLPVQLTCEPIYLLPRRGWCREATPDT